MTTSQTGFPLERDVDEVADLTSTGTHPSPLIEFARSNGNFAYRDANELDRTH